MTRVLLLVVAHLVCACSRPAVAAPPADAGAPLSAAPAPLPPAPRTLAGVRFGNMDKSGGVDFRVQKNGVLDGSYLNRGFSTAGAEVVPFHKQLAARPLAELWAAAEALAAAQPAGHQEEGSGWRSTSTLSLHFTSGADAEFSWNGEGAPSDARVQQLAALMRDTLER